MNDAVLGRNFDAIILFLLYGCFIGLWYCYFSADSNKFELFTNNKPKATEKSLKELHKNCLYSELFLSVFSRIRTEYEEI